MQKFVKIATFGQSNLRKSEYFENLEITVQKFDKFTAFQILREINFEESRRLKSAFLQF